jgi:hypothetical protein
MPSAKHRINSHLALRLSQYFTSPSRAWGAQFPTINTALLNSSLPFSQNSRNSGSSTMYTTVAAANVLHAQQHAIGYFLFTFLAHKAGYVAILFNGAYVPAVIAQVFVNIVVQLKGKIVIGQAEPQWVGIIQLKAVNGALARSSVGLRAHVRHIMRTSCHLFWLYRRPYQPFYLLA